MTFPNMVYPLREIKPVGEQPLAFEFSTFIEYGSEDRSEDGTVLVYILDQDGVFHPRSEWNDIPGVTCKMTQESEGSRMYCSFTIVTVTREACPLELWAKEVSLYESEGHTEHAEEPYCIQCIDPRYLDRLIPVPSPDAEASDEEDAPALPVPPAPPTVSLLERIRRWFSR